MLQMINEWQNKTNKYKHLLSKTKKQLVFYRHKQHHDVFDLAIESFITNMSSSAKHDFISIVNALESKEMM
jgi:hypothetical protein